LGGDAEMYIANFLAIQQCGLGRSNAQCNPSDADDTNMLKMSFTNDDYDSMYLIDHMF
jgi:hypothetical protein